MGSRLSCTLVLLGVSAGVVVAQDAPRPGGAVPTFSVSSSSVLVDVVVRDKKGNLVRDLTPADFEVFEDGVRQRVDAFAVMGGKALADTATPAEPGTPAEAGAPGSESLGPGQPPPAVLPRPEAPPERAIVALVFDKLTPEARKLAHDAALAFVKNGRREGDLVGVFLLDLRLRMVQDFTVSGEALSAAVDQVVRRASLPSTADADVRRLNNSARVTSLNTQLENLGGLQGSVSGSQATGLAMTIGAIASAQSLATIALRMEETFGALERDQRGFASVNGLLAVVNALRILPGRKTVVFFSEGLEVPTAVQDRFESVIHVANRANVSIYTMDAAGLRVVSSQEARRNELVSAGNLRQTQLSSLVPTAVRGPMSLALERTEDLLRSDPHGGLGALAEGTGGFLIHDTNDLAAGFRRINEEMRFYYMLSYAPTNETFDGRFREISVKVKRSGLTVQSRKGYFGVRSQGPVLSYEAPVLALLERTGKPDAFPLRAAALCFPDSKRPGLVSLVVELPGAAPGYALDQGSSAYRTDFVVLARISDRAGNVVDKLSQRYQLSVPEARLDAVKEKPVLFYRETHLPKGRYVLEAVAYDNATSRASLRSLPFEVPSPDGGHLQLGSLVTVARFEQLPKEEIDPGRPLQYGEIQLYPNLGEAVRKSAQRPLVFLVTAWPTPGSSVTRATAEVLHGGEVVRQAALEVPPPEPSGRIQALGQLPIDELRPGDYELRVLVEDARSAETRSAPFRIAE